MKKLLVWDSSVYDMKNGRRVCGIAVQMDLWMRIFAENGWEVHALSTIEAKRDSEGITYHKISYIKYIKILYDWIEIAGVIRRVRPDLVIIRGAQRLMYPLGRLSHFYGAKLVMFGASDVNFVPGKSSLGSALNHYLYEQAVRKHTDFFVTQNEYQAETLKKYFGKDSLSLLNIWGSRRKEDEALTSGRRYDVVWVSNFRRLKRAEWVLDAAKQLPQYRFALIGGPLVDKAYYDEMASEASKIENVEFMGPLSLGDTSSVIARSRLLTCTSEYEGFPNTFLQAWSTGVPVVSTIDPSGIIKAHNLGSVVSSQAEFCESLKALLEDSGKYERIKESIAEFFENNMSLQASYDKLLKYISIC